MLKSKYKLVLATGLGFLVLFSGAGLGAFGGQTKTAYAAVSNWQRGVNMFPSYNTDFSSSNFQQSVKNAKAVGVNYIFLNIPLYQSNIYSTDVQTGGNTPTDQSLTDAINFIHGQGMKVAFKMTLFPYDGQWSAYINPSDRTSWFNNYGNHLKHYAGIAASTGVEEIVIATELISMSAADSNPSNTSNWNALIGAIRGMYSGKLTYSANWGESGFVDEKNHIEFWPALDYIGISAYFNLSGDGSVAQLKNSWDFWNRTQVAPLRQRWGKPVLFTELGYKSIYESYQHPWMWWEGGGANVDQQARDYQALFEYWNGQPDMQGIGLWYWSTDPNAGGQGNIDYTPQNKPAQETMRAWFAGSGTGGTGGGTGGTSTSTGTPTFTASATGNTSGLQPGQNTTFSLSVNNSASSTSNINIDAEIYNAAGSQVFQKVFSGQNFNSGATGSYSVPWTAGPAGEYTLKIGAFSGDWQKLYYWNNGALVFNVGSSSGGGGTGTTTTPGGIDVWWPTNDATISGVQPFKAMLKNASVDTYNMTWKVDGGSENGMATNMTDYPHKEALVDVGTWNWQSSGNYVVTFTTQSLNGQTTAQTAITIHVAR